MTPFSLKNETQLRQENAAVWALYSAEKEALIRERARITELEAVSEGRRVQLDRCSTERAAEWRRAENAEGERDTATRALEAIGSLAVMSEGNVAGGVVSSREVDAIINAALAKTEGKG